MHPAHVRTDDALRAVLLRLDGEQEICIDCEFHPEGHYYPKLCLVQIAFADVLVAVDPFRVDLAALGPMLEAPSLVKVTHAGRQDLTILARAAGIAAIANVFDTQVAAGFAGYGGSIGYGALVRDVCGVELDKSLQVSDWTRELSDAQIDYALDDVRHLSKVRASLRARLVASDRFAWAETACAELVTRAFAPKDPSKLYKRVASIGSLSGRQLGVLREVAIWRDRAAQAIGSPLATVASDLALKSIAVNPPRTMRALGDVRGLGAGRKPPWLGELLEAIEHGVAHPEVGQSTPSREREALVDGIVSMLTLARRFVAARDGIASELLGDQAESRALAEWSLDGRPAGVEHDVLGGWRRAVIGDLFLAALAGEVAFIVRPASPSGIDVVTLGAR